MDWSLISEAKRAEDVASGLQIWLDAIPQCATDISANISELFAISSALRSLDNALDPLEYGSGLHRIKKDLDLVLKSLRYTLGAVREMFGQSRASQYRSVPPYDILWDALRLRFKDEGPSMCSRLEWYRVYINALFDVLKGEFPIIDMESLSLRLRSLVRIQSSLDSYFERITLEAEGPKTPRPAIGRHSTYPSYPNYPLQPPVAHDWEPRIPPQAPEVPHSPTCSTISSQTFSSTQTFSSNSSRDIAPPTHWAVRVFDGRHPSTPFRVTGSPTKCFGRDEPTAESRLVEDNFLCVLRLPFEAADVTIQLHWRPTDHRARILYMATEKLSRRPLRFCIPLSALVARRSGNCLQLCRLNRGDGKLELWASLRFTLFERMVLFYSTFTAMKRQDLVKPVVSVEDYFQTGEVEEFGGEIEDDNYLHAFRVFRDTDSGGIRFEATARRGPMTRTPIWTAFVTHYVGSKTWMRKVSPRVIRLRELHPYIFCDGYMPPRGTSGAFELRFTSKQDADAFTEIFQQIKIK